MDRDNEFGTRGRQRITLRDVDPEKMAARTGLSVNAAEEISYLFCDTAYTPKTVDAIKTMLQTAAEKNAREGLDVSEFSLFRRRRHNKPVAVDGSFIREKSAAEEEILRTALSLIVSPDDAEMIAAELIGKFGSALTVYDAVMQNVGYIGLSSGVAMRLALLLYIYLWNGKRGLSVNSRAAASRFFGEIYLGGGFAGLTVGYLDGEYRLIETNNFVGKFPIDKKRIEAVCAAGEKLGAKYMIAARKYSGDDRSAYFGFASRFSEFSQASEKYGIKLLDFIIYKRNSFFALKDGAIAEGGKIEFNEFLY